MDEQSPSEDEREAQLFLRQQHDEPNGYEDQYANNVDHGDKGHNQEYGRDFTVFFFFFEH